MRTLTLVSGGFGRQDREELRRMEAGDECPRSLVYEDALQSDLLDERYLDRVAGLRGRAYARLPVGLAQVLEAYRVAGRYDAVIAWSDRLTLPLAALLRLSGRRLPYVAILLWVSQRRKAAVLRRVHSHIDRLIVPSPRQREFVLRLGVPRAKVVAAEWGVDHRFWRPMPASTDMICAVGSEMRDYPTLIEALRETPIRCHIAAGTVRGVVSPWVRSIRRQGPLPGHVTVGKLRFAELRAVYARSRLVVVPLLPSDSDNGVTAILEAMAMGKPVVCTRTDGQVGVVVDGETGILVPPGDARRLAEAIRFLWAHPDVAERLGRAGRRRMEAGHTFEAFVGRVKATVEETIAAYPHRRASRLAAPGLAGS